MGRNWMTTWWPPARSSAVAASVVLLSSWLCHCAGAERRAPRPADRPPAPSAVLTHAVARGHRAGPLVFPPAASHGRRSRPALPAHMDRRPPAGAPRVVEPELQPDGSFHIRGQSVRLRFSHPMAGARLDAPAGELLRLQPAAAGLTRWVDEHTLEFVAARAFDPETSYQLELGPVTSRAGQPLGQPFRATFTATPIVVVAGKELDYVPQLGEHRVIGLRPSDGVQVGRSATLVVLYDQPVDLQTARSLVQLVDGRGEPVPIALFHPTTNRFDGMVVDRRLIVLVRARRPLRHGESLKLVAFDHQPLPTPARTSAFTVAEPLASRGVECGYWRDGEQCAFSGGVLRTSGRQVHLRFNNPIRTPSRQLRQHVAVSPAVRNLTIERRGWDEGRLVLSGDFLPSARYRVVVAGLTDRYGSRQRTAVNLELEVAPLGASVIMPEGMLLLDRTSSRRFPITSRNVAKAELRLWPVSGEDAAEFRAALQELRARSVQRGGATRIDIAVRARQDQLVETSVDLTQHLSAGQSYLATIVPKDLAFGAAPVRYPRGSEASRPPVALLRIGAPESLGVHTHRVADALLVHLARLHSGEPVAGAAVSVLGAAGAPRGSTDSNGVALLRLGGSSSAAQLLSVSAAGSPLLVPLDRSSSTAADLFPELTSGERADVADLRTVLITDRGIYRPGATVRGKASVFQRQDGRLQPVAGRLLRLRLLGPTGELVAAQALITGQLGGLAGSLPIAASTTLGRHQLLLEDPIAPDAPLGKTMIRVAEFEPPRFAVDVHVAPDAPATELRAAVRGRYLFGAAMRQAPVEWSVRRRNAPFPAGPLKASGLLFRPEPSWFDEPNRGPTWSRTGEGVLDEQGTLQIAEPANLLDASGPQRFDVEADVTDSSYRHVAGRGTVIRHPAPRYAGLKGPRGWVDVGKDVEVALGVMDTAGASVVGVPVTARLYRVTWRYQQIRVEGGALRGRWTAQRTPVGRCVTRSAERAQPCRLRVPSSGDYEVSAEVDGRAGGRIAFWAWRDGDRTKTPTPNRGSVVQLAADKASYAPGETARVLVRNPYPAATAILTAEAGKLVSHRAARIDGPAGVLEVPIVASHAPHVHATVTLLPIGARGAAMATHRIGAVRLGVSLRDARLELGLTTDRQTYLPGDEAEILATVRRNGRPAVNAEIALAVVDEGVLRLTNFELPDPVRALHPGRPLAFHVTDTRHGLRELLERSHVAGGGGSGEAEPTTEARRRFVKTALWRPALRTDTAGQARVRFRLPDNLTEFRVMALALDAAGKGARARTALRVRKPVMLAAVLPRFAAVGDRFEVAAMVHNTAAQPFHGVVKLGERVAPVSVAPGGRQRVGFDVVASEPGAMNLSLSVSDRSGERDRVVRRIEVEQPGIEHRPRLSGAFVGEQTISARLPAGLVTAQGDDELIIKVGQHLWPELGARLQYLLDYPHGCVEQTTSSTLPLIAARDILPRIGLRRLSDAELNKRIAAGIERLASMQTRSGGLAYWPGGTDPNVYGTAYAIRAVLRAKQLGIAPPDGMLEGMTRYLGARLLDEAIEPEVRAAIAQSLAERGELPASAADDLYDMAAKTSVFGQASLAVALSHLEGEQQRVDRLLDRVEESFDEHGKLVREPKRDDFSYFGSPQRTSAQAAVALSRLRKTSLLLPRLVGRLSRNPSAYTTQGTAYALLAIAEQLRQSAGSGAAVDIRLDGQPLEPTRDLGAGSREYRIGLAALSGSERTIRLSSSSRQAVAFQLEARYRLPVAGGEDEARAIATTAPTLVATSAQSGPDVYRAYTDATGAPIDLADVAAGSIVRVALLVRLPDELEPSRRGYLAITDRLPAGFEPVDPDLATVAQAPEVSDEHPFSELLRGGQDRASFVELRDDRVQIYFDKPWDREVVATYLARATTPGRFVLPPAAAELMYEPDSLSYSEAAQVVVR